MTGTFINSFGHYFGVLGTGKTGRDRMDKIMTIDSAVLDAITLLQNHGVNTVGVNLEINPFSHSFEFGPANSRHKIYYSDSADLKKKIEAALDAENHLNQLKGNNTGGAPQ